MRKSHKVSEATKIKISNKLIGIKRPNLKGKHLSEEHKEKLKLKSMGNQNSKGSKSSFWKGGITPIVKLIRQSSKYLQWRQDIFIRDNFTCQKCGAKSGYGKAVYLEAHHKYPFYKLVQEARNLMPLLDLYEACMIYSPLWNLKNGITWCSTCHNKTKKGGKR